MVKDQVVYLPKKVPNLNIALGWNAGCDVDCSILTFDKKGNYFDMASFMQKSTNDGAIKHGGDDTSGEGAGDDETIKIHLPQVTANV
jgi:stress response protein SCP2